MHLPERPKEVRGRDYPLQLVLRELREGIVGPVDVPVEGEEPRQLPLGVGWRRYYGQDSGDKAGILRYTKVTDTLIDLTDVPPDRKSTRQN